MLKHIVNFATMLIGAEGARLLREYGAGETPQARVAPRRLPGPPAESERLERKSTGKLTEPYFKIDKRNYRSRPLKGIKESFFKNIQTVIIKDDFIHLGIDSKQ
jgi:hypothetical protein